jgi:hypothetical protein
MGVRRPVWILAALMVSELTIANYMWEFGGSRISNRLILTLVSIPLIMPHVVQRPDLGPRTRSMVLVALGFLAVTTFANLVAGDTAYVLKFARYLITGLIALMLAPAAVNSSDDVRDLSLAVLVVSAASALVAVLQHYSQFTDALFTRLYHPGSGPTLLTPGGRAVGWRRTHLRHGTLFRRCSVGRILLGD